MADKLKKKFGTNKSSHFHLADFLIKMQEKANRGQLVRLVDFFGLFVGDYLLDVSINYCKLL
jgi:hypothetical protein